MLQAVIRMIGATVVLALCSAVAVGEERQAFAVVDSFVHRLHSEKTDADYNVYVGLPRGYDATKKYPALLVHDGDYAFPIAQSIARHLVDRGELLPLIVVAIAYPGAVGDPSKFMLGRTRDLTPSFTMEGGYGADFQLASGGAAKYVAFLASELKPYVEGTYAIDPKAWTLVGHSYGGLFGAYVLMVAPGLFQHYLIVSPSFWYDNRALLTSAADGLDSLRKHEGRIFLGVGALENDPSKGRFLVDDVRSFEGHLRALGNQRLSITANVFADETHHSVFPAALSRGLRLLIGSPAAPTGD
jgi:predicted alpha/beta superfamily hydrolase